MPSPHHLREHDERVGGEQQLAQERQLVYPERPGAERLRKMLPGQVVGQSSVQVFMESLENDQKTNGYWDQHASQILYKCEESNHPIVPGTENPKQSTLTQEEGKDIIHLNAATES